MILNRIAPVVEQRLIKKQAGFRIGKSCTSQLLNLAQHIEDGYQRGMITGAAFVYLYAAYDTVNHRIRIQKLYNITQDSPLCRVILNMLCSTRFYVELNSERSRWLNRRTACHREVSCPPFFSTSTLTTSLSTTEHLASYTQTICVSQLRNPLSQTTIEESLSELTHYYRSNNLRTNLDKTHVTAFHLRNKEAKRTLKMKWNKTYLENTPHHKYLLQTTHPYHEDEGGETQQSH